MSSLLQEKGQCFLDFAVDCGGPVLSSNMEFRDRNMWSNFYTRPLHSRLICSSFLSFLIFFTRMILPVVLYGCETWSLTLREERKLRVFENKVLWRVFGPRRDEGTGEWRRLHNEELNDLYSSPNIVRVIKSRRMRWVGHVARMGEERGVYRVLVGKP